MSAGEGRTWDKTELAWGGGFFEGEGSFYTQNIRTAVASLESTDLDALQRFQAAVQMGKILGPRQRMDRPSHCKPSWRWRLTNYEEAQQLAILLWPWLCSRRREQTTLALVRAQARIPYEEVA